MSRSWDSFRTEVLDQLLAEQKVPIEAFSFFRAVFFFGAIAYRNNLRSIGAIFGDLNPQAQEIIRKGLDGELDDFIAELAVKAGVPPRGSQDERQKQNDKHDVH